MTATATASKFVPYAMELLDLRQSDLKKPPLQLLRVLWRRTMNAIFRHFLGLVMWTAGCCVWPACRLAAACGSAGRRRCPPIRSELLKIPAVRMAEMIRSGQLLSELVVSAYIERCRDVQPVLNAIVDSRYDAAMREARDADALVAAVNDGTSSEMTSERLAREMPLLGVPVTVKESICVRGMSNTSGRVARRDAVATSDADVVRQVRQAGGIILLVSNTPELCMSWETYNKVSGLTRNPYDGRRTAAGSSGGEGALLGSGASLLSLSSDIGGSCRLPAMFNGVFGHKPTPRAVSTRGHMPSSDAPDWPEFFTIAPMTRYAVDLPLLLKVMGDPAGPRLQLDFQVPLNAIKVYYMENDGDSGVTAPVDREIKEAMRKAVGYLASVQGVKPVKVNLKKLKYSFEVAALMLLRIEGVDSIYSVGSSATSAITDTAITTAPTANTLNHSTLTHNPTQNTTHTSTDTTTAATTNATTVSKDPAADITNVITPTSGTSTITSTNNTPAGNTANNATPTNANADSMKSVWPELLRYLSCRSDSILTPVMYGPLKKFARALPESRYKRLCRLNEELRFDFQNLLGSDGVFLYPTFPSLAHFHYEIFHKILNCSYMMIFNSLGLPVTNCTLGLSKDGLPIGIQIAANPCQDHLTIALAQELERAFGGWVPPPCTTD